MNKERKTLNMLVAELLAVWTTANMLACKTADSGTLNQTFLCETSAGHYVLKRYRFTDRRRVECEHELIKYAYEQGLPAIVPLCTLAGGDILEHAGRYYALFPFAPGCQISRDALGKMEAEAMGSFLARLHHTLSAYPSERVPQLSLTIDPADTFARIAQIEAAIRALPTLDIYDLHSLEQLTVKREWIAQHTFSDEVAKLTEIAYQVVHGDYQETNLFFEEERVSAIIDWEKAYRAPRAWEVIRTLHLSLKFEPTLSRAFLEAYRRHLPLSLDDLDVTIACYSLVDVYNLWVYETFYVQRDERLRTFLGSGHFTTVADCWAVLREELSW